LQEVYEHTPLNLKSVEPKVVEETFLDDGFAIALKNITAQIKKDLAREIE